MKHLSAALRSGLQRTRLVLLVGAVLTFLLDFPQRRNNFRKIKLIKMAGILELTVAAAMLSSWVTRPALADHGPEQIQGTIINCLTPPQISYPSVTAPAPGSLLARSTSLNSFVSNSDIYYVAGKMLDIALTIPTCTFVSAVKVSGNNVPQAEQVDQIEGGSTYYRILSDQSLPNGWHRVTLRLHFRNLGQGVSLPVQILVRNPNLRVAAAEFNFTMVQVKEVGGNVAISLSEAELRNDVILGFLDLVTRNDRLYNFNFDGLVFEINSNGIYIDFESKFVLDPSGTIPCDPTIGARALFTLRLDPNQGLLVVDWKPFYRGGLWHKSPDPKVDAPLGCDLASAGLTILAGEILESVARDRLAKQIQNQVTTAVTGYFPEGIPNPVSLISSIETHPDELRMNLDMGEVDRIVELGQGSHRLPGRGGLHGWVTIEVPYRALDPDTPANFGAFALKANDAVIVVASGLAGVCETDGSRMVSGPTWPNCVPIKAGPTGLPTGRRTDIHSICTRGDRDSGGACRNLDKLWRARPIPLANENVGALIARQRDGSTVMSPGLLGTVGSVFQTSQAGWLEFGTNDHRSVPDHYGRCGGPCGSEYGSGLFRITLMWMTPAMPTVEVISR